mgnify:CR=1 FL=1
MSLLDYVTVRYAGSSYFGPTAGSIELRAEVDTLVAISNCPQINNPCNGFNPTPVHLIVT